MTDTIISSATKEVVIGFDRPFVIIGERINPTGRKILAAEMAAGDFTRVEADARAQVEAGAHMLDVNAGIPLADEPAILARAIQLVQSITDVPLSIDSSIVAALEAGLAVYKGKALVNSVTGEDERLEAVLPLIKKYGAAVIAISNDETGISEDPDVRYAVAKKIVERAMDYGIPACDVVVDPLVMPIGAINQAGVQVMRLVHRLRTELKVNTSCGASNISFGLPNRDGINSAFLDHGDGRGHDLGDHQSACTWKSSRPCMGADVMLGHDPDCARWIRRFPRRAPSRRGCGRHAAAGRGGRPSAARPARRRPSPPAGLKSRRFAWRPGIHSSYSRLPASAAIFPWARRCCRRRAASAWTSTRCAAAAVFAAAARYWSRRASSPSMACPRRAPACRRSASRKGASRGACRLAEGRRLSCSARVEADVVIDVPASSQVHRQVVRKEADAHAIELNPVVRLHYVQVKEPDMHDPSGDLRRLFEALEARMEPEGSDLRSIGAADAAGGACARGRGRSRWRCTPPSKSSGCGPDCTNWPMDSRSTSARPRLPRTSATWAAARWSPPRAS